MNKSQILVDLQKQKISMLIPERKLQLHSHPLFREIKIPRSIFGTDLGQFSEGFMGSITTAELVIWREKVQMCHSKNNLDLVRCFIFLSFSHRELVVTHPSCWDFYRGYKNMCSVSPTFWFVDPFFQLIYFVLILSTSIQIGLSVGCIPTTITRWMVTTDKPKHSFTTQCWTSKTRFYKLPAVRFELSKKRKFWKKYEKNK